MRVKKELKSTHLVWLHAKNIGKNLRQKKKLETGGFCKITELQTKTMNKCLKTKIFVAQGVVYIKTL